MLLQLINVRFGVGHVSMRLSMRSSRVWHFEDMASFIIPKNAWLRDALLSTLILIIRLNDGISIFKKEYVCKTVLVSDVRSDRPLSFYQRSVSIHKTRLRWRLIKVSIYSQVPVWHAPRAMRWWTLIRLWTHKSLPIPDSKVHGANMGPIWGRQDPGGP